MDNRSWFKRLPEDLQQIQLTAISEESAKVRALTEKQQLDQIAAAKAEGIVFKQLSAAEKARLVDLAEPVVQKWGEKIGLDYLEKVRAALKN